MLLKELGHRHSRKTDVLVSVTIHWTLQYLKIRYNRLIGHNFS
ncbi:hypothetical protein PL11201_80164 [Planktothrix sp. PCC 11201]|nr:hypothetical protein PL11201_80164 [Planktothrix sp. PCC 11201]